MFNVYALLLLVLAAGLCASCAPGPQLPDSAPEPVLTPEQPFGPSRDFQTLVHETLSRQYTSLSTLLKEPDNPRQTDPVLTALENPVLILQSGVTALSGGADYLAAGYENGNIRIWSSYPCAVTGLPDREQVTHIWWKGDSPYLLAAGQSSPTLYLFDLNRCAAARGPEITGRPVLASLS
ncbi:MAG: hypothetical protein ACOCV7_03230, partial [Desulfonatronovibrionaceae bacterium]